MRDNFTPFELERTMSIWEHQVEYNLSESGVHPMTVAELLDEDPKSIDDLLATGLNYPQTNGSIELRDRIASLYPGATRDNIVVTTGAAQANFTSILSLLDPGDQIAVMMPNYMQIWGVAVNYRLDVRTFQLREHLGWAFDVDDLGKTVTGKTKLIAVCNPNNPTGHIMSQHERQAVVGAAERCGTWILSDEVYAGAEHNTDQVTPTLWGDYEKVLAIGSLSKAYALPGLRIGWVVAPTETADEIWARQDYITISATILGQKLAAHALAPKIRARLIERTRQYIRRGYHTFESWRQENSDIFTLVPPQAAAIAFIRYHKDVNSSELVDRLIHRRSTYVVPGDHFGLDQHLRISYGLSDDYVREGLRRVVEELRHFAAC